MLTAKNPDDAAEILCSATYPPKCNITDPCADVVVYRTYQLSDQNQLKDLYFKMIMKKLGIRYCVNLITGNPVVTETTVTTDMILTPLKHFIWHIPGTKNNLSPFMPARNAEKLVRSVELVIRPHDLVDEYTRPQLRFFHKKNEKFQIPIRNYDDSTVTFVFYDVSLDMIVDYATDIFHSSVVGSSNTSPRKISFYWVNTDRHTINSISFGEYMKIDTLPRLLL